MNATNDPRGNPQSMATAEYLIHEAQYAFHSISFGKSRENRRNSSRAKSLCKKIIRKFPASMEAAEAHAILRRLGEEAYSSKIALQHRHVPQSTHHQPSPATPRSHNLLNSHGEPPEFSWGTFIAWVFMLPKAVLAVITVAGFFLFGLFGPFLFLPLLAFVLLTGPFRNMLKPEQRKELDTFVVQANAYLADRRG